MPPNMDTFLVFTPGGDLAYPNSTQHHPWWTTTTTYQIYPPSFSDSNNDGLGDIPGILSRIPYLHRLGVETIWLSPIYASPQKDMGYDISDYRAIHPPYGTMQDVERLISEVHGSGMRLILDLVVNHTSDEHAWFKESRKARGEEEMRKWYIWRKGKERVVIEPVDNAEVERDANSSSANMKREGSKSVEGTKVNGNGQTRTRVIREPPNNWRSVFGESAWTYDPPSDEWYLHLFCPEQPDLNWEHPPVREAVYEVMRYWLDKGVDGFRMDVINLISKHPDLPDAPVTNPKEKYQHADMYFANGPRLHEFLQEMRREVLGRYDVMTVGEMPWVDDKQEVLKCVQRGRGELDMIFQFDIVDIDIPPNSPHKFLRQSWPLSSLKKIVNTWQLFMQSNNGWNAVFMENHDQPRSVSRYVTMKDYRRHRFTASKMLATFLATQSGTLFVFQGQEIGMGNLPREWGIEEYKDVETLNHYDEIKRTSNNDPLALAAAMEEIRFRARDNARTPFQWDDTNIHGGFTSAESKPWMRVNTEYTYVNAASQVDDPSSVYNYWRRLLKIRRSREWVNVLVHGEFRMLAVGNEDVMVFERTFEGKKVVAMMNFKDKVVEVDLVKNGVDIGVNPDAGHHEGKVNVLISNYELVDGGKLTVKGGKILLREFEAMIFGL